MKSKKANKFCIQCGGAIETSFETKFCSSPCWEKYKSDRGLNVAIERKATVFIKTKDNQMEQFPISEKDWKSLATAKSIMLLKDNGSKNVIDPDKMKIADVEIIDPSTVNEKTVILNKNMFSADPDQPELQIDKIIAASEEIKEQLNKKNEEIAKLLRENSKIKGLSVKLKEKELVIRKLKKEILKQSKLLEKNKLK